MGAPITSITYTLEQPSGGLHDGLALREVWGYGFCLRQGASGTGHLQQAPPVDLRVNAFPLMAQRE